jgi:L-amino acid N-acyltransferase YncA
VIVRPATEGDVAATLALVNAEIAGGVAHFGIQAITLDDALAQHRAQAERYPCLVAVDERGELLGFARAGPWKTREAYAWTVELGVYVAPAAQGRGVARELYAQLLPELEARGFRTLIAGIALPNPACVKLHEALGFEPAGVLPRVGFKHGAWRDVGYWALHLGEGSPASLAGGLTRPETDPL